MRLALISLTTTALLGIGCGGTTDPATGPNGKKRWENRKPTLMVASPYELSVGEDVKILGKDFITAKYGKPVLLFQGRFFDDQGKTHKVNLQKDVKIVDTENKSDWRTKLKWKMWPNVVFHPNGDHLGTFIGEVRVANVAKDGSREVSDGLPVKFQIKPSLIPRVVRPINGCNSNVLTKSLGSEKFVLAVEALGLRKGTEENPLVFHWSFIGKDWDVEFNYGVFNVDSVFKKTGSFVLQDKVKKGRYSVVSDPGAVKLPFGIPAPTNALKFLVKAGSDLLGSSSLKKLSTRKVSEANKGKDQADSYNTTVNVAAVDASGKSAVLAIPLAIYKQATLHYDGTQKLAERLQPQMVSECIPGGDIGRYVTYREDKAETRQRGMAFQYNANAGLTLGLPSNPFALALNLSAGFGVDVNASVSSSKSRALDMNGQILPGDYGVFYRQTTKVYRIGKLVGHTKCGGTVNLGDAILTDWIWSPDLATGSSCPPKPNLPKPQKFLDLDVD